MKNNHIRIVFALLAATLWISLSEFTRNQWALHDIWVSHFTSLHEVFPETPVNGAIWGLWSLLFAVFMFRLSSRFSFWESVGLSWLTCFLMMWIVTGNLSILPVRILPIAIPWSLAETMIAILLIKKISAKNP